MIMKAYAAPRYCKNQVKQVLGIHIDSLHSDKNTSCNDKLTEEVCE